ncbi:MAG: FIG00463164: hypothetical protein [uncultured Paraburkholderia sp.]|nr:MAG: FIG00463164: hypothetical protein [uncultured Paraburkholderia sp.]CAH2914871.1 MAG: FIG00463164: hypothetical protein [uncultured Paraburkholderia sp.]
MQNEDNVPENAAAPGSSPVKHAHRPEPIEPPSAPPSPGELNTVPTPVPVPSPDSGPQPIEPIEPVALPIGDPQPTQTPQARRS